MLLGPAGLFGRACGVLWMLTCAHCLGLAQELDLARARVAELEARLVVPETVRLVRRVFLAAHEKAMQECAR
jgi:hypothetical protein